MPPDMEAINEELEAIWETARNDWRYRRTDYGDAFLELGSKGQFSDIWRKIAKLKNNVWDGQELTGDSPEQIAKEIIPHCVMMIYCLRRENG